jgi:hypothetical protein
MAVPCNDPCRGIAACLIVRNEIVVGSRRPPQWQNGTPVSSRNASIDLPPTAGSVPAARHLVLTLLQAWDAPHDRDDAALLVTELVSDVVDHVQGDAVLTLEVGVSDDWLRIAVVDGSSSVLSSGSCRWTGLAGAGCGWCRPSPTGGARRTIAAASGCGWNCGPRVGEPGADVAGPLVCRPR